MVQSCSVFGCKRRWKKDGSINFHKFPQGELRSLWIKAIRRKNYNPSNSAVVCSEHFKPEDYKNNRQLRCLKDGAIPSIFKRNTIRLRSGRTLDDPFDDDSSKLPKSIPNFSFVINDHSYAFPSSISDAKKKYQELSERLQAKIREEQKQRHRVYVLEKKGKKIKDQLSKVTELLRQKELVLERELLREKEYISPDSLPLTKDRFSDVELNVVKTLIGPKSNHAIRYSNEVKEFAVTLYACSPKAYEFISSLFTLPSPRSIRNFVGPSNYNHEGIVDCLESEEFRKKDNFDSITFAFE